MLVGRSIKAATRFAGRFSKRAYALSGVFEQFGIAGAAARPLESAELAGRLYRGRKSLISARNSPIRKAVMSHKLAALNARFTEEARAVATGDILEAKHAIRSKYFARKRAIRRVPKIIGAGMLAGSAVFDLKYGSGPTRANQSTFAAREIQAARNKGRVGYSAGALKNVDLLNKGIGGYA